MNLLRFSVVALVSLTLAACGIVRDRSNDYINAEHGEPLKVPEWYQQSAIEPKHPIPPIDNRRGLPAKYKLPTPPDATIAILTENYVVESLDDQTWLLINDAPGRIWPSLDRFWEENGIIVKFENPSLGLMQTEVVGSTLLSNQLLSRIDIRSSRTEKPLLFQAKLGQGVKRNTTELQVRVLSTQKGTQVFKEWSGRPGNEEAEKKLLNIISSYLENNQSYRSYSLLANDIGGNSKVALIADQGAQLYLNLDLSFERAWSSVSKALRGAKIKVADLDRSQGVFYLDYGREEESSGWFSGLFSDKDNNRPEYNYRLQLNKVEESYQLKVNKVDEEVKRVEEMEILNLLLDNIS